MEENYISIFTNYLADMLEQRKIELPVVILLVKEFEAVCDGITTREKLVEFLDKYLQGLPALGGLKLRLQDKTYKFNLK